MQITQWIILTILSSLASLNLREAKLRIENYLSSSEVMLNDWLFGLGMAGMGSNPEYIGFKAHIIG